MPPPGAYCRYRLFEWVTTAMMLGIAATIAVGGAAVHKGAFRLLIGIGLDEHWLGAFFLIFGALRIVALLANGRWPVYGPSCRAAGALAAALLWAQMALALIGAAGERGALSLGISVFVCLAGGEIVSCYRARADVRNSVS